jgi:hypothetical protein
VAYPLPRQSANAILLLSLTFLPKMGHDFGAIIESDSIKS